MIKTFRHKGLEIFFRKGSKAGIQPHHARKLNLMLSNWIGRQLMQNHINYRPLMILLPGQIFTQPIKPMVAMTL